MTYEATNFLRRLSLALGVLVSVSACTATHPPKSYIPDRSTIQEGDTVTVKDNQNIYSVAREHNVSMRELISLNNLKPPYEVRPGQTLILPAGSAGFNGNSMPAPSAAPLAPVEKNTLAPIEPAGVSSETLAPLTSAPGAPASVSQPSAPASAAPFAPQSLTAPQTLPPPSVAKPIAPTAAREPVPALNHPAPLAQPAATTMASSVSASASTINMVWPVQGPILSAYGSKSPGLNNDGVNIGAPKGAAVVAAAPGTVVYAGDEMKGFGNLVLIRHESDWVTAYAHLDRVLVKKDSIVGQGDQIGTVGKTGNVSSPQLHFETRKDGKPVDPASVVKSPA